ncbi:MAG: hypothetical protein AAGL49_15575, partial [Pseudomonadota bacterium]
MVVEEAKLDVMMVIAEAHASCVEGVAAKLLVGETLFPFRAPRDELIGSYEYLASKSARDSLLGLAGLDHSRIEPPTEGDRRRLLIWADAYRKAGGGTYPRLPSSHATAAA